MNSAFEAEVIGNINDGQSNMSFELTLLELASGAKDSRVRTRLGPGNRGDRTAQFIVIWP